jgi:membrane protease YdiL (CAAX protease family)
MSLAKNRPTGSAQSPPESGPQGESDLDSAVATPRGREGIPLGLAVGFYAAVGVVAWAWRAWTEGGLPWTAPGVEPWPVLARVLAGVVAGLALVATSRAFTRRTEAGQALARELGRAVGHPTPAAIAALALASGVAEEALFRGALQPQVGWLAASGIFGLAHYVPRPGLRLWSVWAALAGLVLGGLFELSGDLLAPAIAHVLVNGMNLGWMARQADAVP